MRVRPTSICRYANATILLFVAMYALLIPAVIIIRTVRDPGLRDGTMPRVAFAWHQDLSPRYERWARERVAAGTATQKRLDDIAGTEWPVFGSVFYLWATEALQDAWTADRTLAAVAPAESARGTIDAAAALVADPGHAEWVRQHWGDDYLHRENVFYRELLIAGLTAHVKLTGSDQYLPLLRDQVVTLAAALDRSPFGLLDDYPAQCYPTDVLGAVAAIRRADAVLGTDHSAFARRELRGFQGPLLDATGLPPYAVDSGSGERVGRSRGCGDSFMLIWTPALWPDVAPAWYDRYEQHFWQHRWTAVGFREFPKDMPDGDWFADVDAGPVLAGHGIAACAFGIGAARANGRLDHAYPLTAEMLITAWPLPDGTLACPRMLSNAVDAPYLGEAGVLFALTRMPAAGTTLITGGHLPGFFYLGLSLYLGVGLLILLGTWRGLRRWRRQPSEVPWERGQAVLWAFLLIGGVVVAIVWTSAGGAAMILATQLLPRVRRKRGADLSPVAPAEAPGTATP